MVAEPIEKVITPHIESGLINSKYGQAYIEKYLKDNFKWDSLSAKKVWAFGPDLLGTNVIMDYTLPHETNIAALYEIKNSVIQGFDWACKEGPLCEEPIRNVKFKIFDASIAKEGILRLPGQIIPAVRRVCLSSMLMASPRLLEPQLLAEIMCTSDCIQQVYIILARRRGHVNSETPKPGTTFYIIHASLPALDSFGFETDIRTQTAGQAFVLTWFDQWALMPGDPLDRSIVLKPLEPSTPPQLAREALIKTRKRKGLIEDVLISKFFDDPTLLEIVKQEEDFKQYYK